MLTVLENILADLDRWVYNVEAPMT
jgi:hypothetical protein